MDEQESFDLSHFAGPAASLSANATRALADRSYDKRKAGALEVEGVVKALVAEQKRTGISTEEGVAKVVRRLGNDFIVSSNSNARKGGLIGLAAVAIGLGQEICQKNTYPLDLLLPPVLKLFDDSEARVIFFYIYIYIYIYVNSFFFFFLIRFDIMLRKHCTI